MPDTTNKQIDLKFDWTKISDKSPSIIGVKVKDYSELLDVLAIQKKGLIDNKPKNKEIEIEEEEPITVLKKLMFKIGDKYTNGLFRIQMLLLVFYLVFIANSIGSLRNGLNEDEFAGLIITIIGFPFMGWFVIYKKSKDRRKIEDRKTQLEIINDILDTYEDIEIKERELMEIIEIKADNRAYWKIYDPDWTLITFYPDFTLADFVTIITFSIAASSLILFDIYDILISFSDLEELFLASLILLILLLDILVGFVYAKKQDTFEFEWENYYSNSFIFLIPLLGSLPLAIIGEFYFGDIIFFYFVLFLIFSITPFLTYILYNGLSILRFYNISRKKIITLIEKEERKWDASLKSALTNENQYELLKTLTALFLHRYSLDRSKQQPIIPNSNLNLIVFTGTVLLSAMGIIIWLLSNLNIVADLIFE